MKKRILVLLTLAVMTLAPMGAQEAQAVRCKAVTIWSHGRYTKVHACWSAHRRCYWYHGRCY